MESCRLIWDWEWEALTLTHFLLEECREEGIALRTRPFASIGSGYRLECGFSVGGGVA